MILHENFKSRLREALKYRGWSQSDLARRMEMTPQQLGEYYHGKKQPALDQLERFSTALEIRAIYLIDDVPIEENLHALA